MTDRQERHRKRKLFPVLLVLVWVGVIGYGLYWWQNKPPSPANQTAASTQIDGEQDSNTPIKDMECPDEPEGLTAYTNRDLRLGFCYTEAWGEVEVSDQSNVPEGSTGKRWSFTFTRKSEIGLGMASKDWQAGGGHGGGCTFPTQQAVSLSWPFSAEWQITHEDDSESPSLMSVMRTLEVQDNSHVIIEEAENVSGQIDICMNGHVFLGGDDYRYATVWYSTDFNSRIRTPQQHMENSEVRIPPRDRVDFSELVNSITLLGQRPQEDSPDES